MPGDQETFEPPRDKPTVFFDEGEPLVMVITIPVGAYAEDKENGSALLRGKLDEAKAVGMAKLQELRVKKARTGIMAPGKVTVH